MSADVEAIAAYLTAAGIAGGSTGWAIHNLASLDSPDREVTIYSTGGPEPEQDTARRWRRPTFQLAVRGYRDDPKAASDKAIAILAALDRASTVNGFDLMFASQSAPLFLGRDQTGRPRFVVNFRAGET